MLKLISEQIQTANETLNADVASHDTLASECILSAQSFQKESSRIRESLLPLQEEYTKKSGGVRRAFVQTIEQRVGALQNELELRKRLRLVARDELEQLKVKPLSWTTLPISLTLTFIFPLGYLAWSCQHL